MEVDIELCVVSSCDDSQGVQWAKSLTLYPLLNISCCWEMRMESDSK